MDKIAPLHKKLLASLQFIVASQENTLIRKKNIGLRWESRTNELGFLLSAENSLGYWTVQDKTLKETWSKDNATLYMLYRDVDVSIF